MRVTDDFYDRLQGVLNERGLSQSDLAKRLRTHASTLTRWRQGAQPQTNMLILLSEELQIPIEWLARGTGPQKMTSPAHEKPGIVKKRTGQTTADIEQDAAHNRLTDMSYSLREDPPGEPKDILTDLMEFMTVTELLTLAQRLGSSDRAAALNCVLETVKARTGPPPPVNYITSAKTKP